MDYPDRRKTVFDHESKAEILAVRFRGYTTTFSSFPILAFFPGAFPHAFVSNVPVPRASEPWFLYCQEKRAPLLKGVDLSWLDTDCVPVTIFWPSFLRGSNIADEELVRSGSQQPPQWPLSNQRLLRWEAVLPKNQSTQRAFLCLFPGPSRTRWTRKTRKDFLRWSHPGEWEIPRCDGDVSHQHHRPKRYSPELLLEVRFSTRRLGQMEGQKKLGNGRKGYPDKSLNLSELPAGYSSRLWGCEIGRSRQNWLPVFSSGQRFAGRGNTGIELFHFRFYQTRHSFPQRMDTR